MGVLDAQNFIKKVILKRIPIVKYRKTEYINSREDKTKRRKEKNEARCGGVLGEMRKQKRC